MALKEGRSVVSGGALFIRDGKLGPIFSGLLVVGGEGSMSLFSGMRFAVSGGGESRDAIS